MSQCFYAWYWEFFHYMTSEFASAQMLDEFSRGVFHTECATKHISFLRVLRNRFLKQCFFLQVKVHFLVIQIGFLFHPTACVLFKCPFDCLTGAFRKAPLITLICRTTKTHTQTNYSQGTSELKSGDKWHRICVLLVRLYKEPYPKYS